MHTPLTTNLRRRSSGALGTSLLLGLFALGGCSKGGGGAFFPAEAETKATIRTVSPPAIRVSAGETLRLFGDGLDLGAPEVASARVEWTPVERPGEARMLPAQILDSESLSFEAPASRSTGPIAILVEVLDADGEVLRLTEPGSAGYSVYELSPTSGDVRGGTLIEIRGLDFESESVQVELGGEAATVQKLDASERSLTARTPAATSAKAVDIRLSGFVIPTSGGPTPQELVLERAFQYENRPPTLARLEPDGGSVAGGTEIEISGDRFTADLIVEIGGQPLASVEVLGEDRARGIVPEGADLGVVDVIVRNGVGTSAPMPFAYRFPVSLRRRSVTPSPVPRSGFGTGLDTLDDVSQDGFGDLVIGSPEESSGDGAVRFVSGADGREILYVVSGPIGAGEGFGAAVARLRGDVDFDGKEDAVASAPFADGGQGALYVLSPGRRRVHERVAALPGDVGLGVAVLSLGDLDSDGIPDFAAGLTASATSPNGAVRVYSGVAPGLVHVTLDAPDPSVADFGISLDLIEDLDGDTFDDVVIGSRGDGVTTFGGAFAFTSGTRIELLRVGGSSGPPYAEGPVAGISDLDGDGLGELAYAAEGRVRVVSGASGDLLLDLEVGSPVSDLAAAGDVDADGVMDVVAGSSLFGGSSGQEGPGLSLIFSGRSGEVLHRFEGSTATAGWGRSVAGAGRLHRDGLPDVLVAAPGASVEGETDRGLVGVITQDNLVPRWTSIPIDSDLVFDVLSPAEAGASAFVAFAFGNSPGVKVGTRTIPLTNDVLFQVSLLVAQFRGILDDSGYFQLRLAASDLVNLPFRGLPIFSAMITLDATPEVIVISNGTSFVLE